ncbi:putative ABC transport system ATP-binding protein [Longibaculum muris]|uniref:Putative ABC transport system ATP-binding protein n=2 Tax=Longibaculum muris TaxID=1796628 RepID=A0A4R3YSH5_9FIRM|nr:ABC transporter, ATP-binding protein [Candidatus Stoquefichus sp. KLE1796]TCV94234.1 putative ABC transport system ATP-binding protein [Longibaculum muris]
MCYGYNRGKGGKKMKILEVKNLTKIYGTGENEVKALDHVSFSVEKGEFIAIVGSSGSGKSTLLHLIGGVDKPTSGEVIVNGINVYQQNEEQLAIFRRREVGLIYQFYNLIPVLTVEENMTLPVLLDNQKVNSVRLEELLKILDLTNRKNHLPKELSGGQQQRVSIGRALMNAPSLVLADEPTGNLDSKNSKEIIDLLKITQQKYKQTLIMITHDERIAMQADRVIVIEDGQIKKDEVLKK